MCNHTCILMYDADRDPRLGFLPHGRSEVRSGADELWTSLQVLDCLSDTDGRSQQTRANHKIHVMSDFSHSQRWELGHPIPSSHNTGTGTEREVGKPLVRKPPCCQNDHVLL